MNFEQFTTQVCALVQNRVGDECKITTRNVLKNNSVKLLGLVIQRPGINVSPTIYLDDLFERYVNGLSIDDVVDIIIDCEEKNHSNHSIDADMFMDFDRIREKIFLKFINTERNEELLLDVPNRSFMDLSVVYYLDLNCDCCANAVSLIHNNQLDVWDVTESELYNEALNNIKRELPDSLINMRDLVYELSGETLPEIPEEPEMYVYTNRNRFYGAGLVFLFDNAGKFAKKHGSFFVLPSSIHETILVPDSLDIDRDYLKDMVYTINRTEVDEDELLSDNVYHFDAEKACFNILN